MRRIRYVVQRYDDFGKWRNLRRIFCVGVGGAGDGVGDGVGEGVGWGVRAAVSMWHGPLPNLLQTFHY